MKFVKRKNLIDLLSVIKEKSSKVHDTRFSFPTKETIFARILGYYRSKYNLNIEFPNIRRASVGQRNLEILREHISQDLKLSLGTSQVRLGACWWEYNLWGWRLLGLVPFIIPVVIKILITTP